MSLKETIIEESMRLFSLKGFFSTSLQDILKASNSSKGGFYNHFKSKEDLFFHVLEKARSIWQERNLQGLDQTDDGFEKIEILLSNYEHRYLKDSVHFPGGCLFITLSVEMNDRDPKLFLAINRGFTGVKKMIQGFLDSALTQGKLKAEADIEVATEILVNGMLGASISYGGGKSAASLEVTMNALRSYLMSLKAKDISS